MTRVSFHIDDSEVRNLYIDLRGAPHRVQFGAEKTLRRSAKVLKAAMREDASGHRYLPHFAAAISDEMLDRYTAEVGFDKRGQGNLANIIVFGSVNNAPVYDFAAAPRRAQPVIDEMFGDLGEESVLGGEK